MIYEKSSRECDIVYGPMARARNNNPPSSPDQLNWWNCSGHDACYQVFVKSDCDELLEGIMSSCDALFFDI